MTQKEYKTKDITIVWKPDLCTHAGVCVRSLPKVYDPKAQPWVTPENATTEELKNQISQCPSGALSYYDNNDSEESQKAEPNCTVQVINGGPLIMKGEFEYTDKEGKKVIMSKSSFCRCGASSNKPFCDGSHKQMDWE